MMRVRMRAGSKRGSRSHQGEVSTGTVGATAVAATVTVVMALGGFTTPAVNGTSGRPGNAAPASAPQPACTPGTLVQTKSGPVCGTTNDDVTSYLGIPYAAPPVGDLRWRSPRPVEPWTTALHATTEGNICPGPSQTSDDVPGSEDCLNLDVRVPADAHPGERLPVIVGIHGGGFLDPIGPGDGSHMVASGHVVFMAMNYRLGILGFMANRALGRHSGDYGLQDQQAALRWLKRNVARFGGDPDNVTIIGASAGGASVCSQVASPTARGLFQKAISQSGFYNAAIGPQQVWEAADCKSQIPTQRQAERAGHRFAAKVGCGHTSRVADCLRQVPVDKLVEAGGKVNDPTAGGTSATIAPTINGETLTMSPAVALRTGRINHVGLMIGVARDEFNGFGSVQSPAAHSPAEFHKLVRKQYGRLAGAVEGLYSLDRFSSPFVAYRTVVADSDSVCPALVADQHVARHGARLFAYEDDDADMPNVWPDYLLDPTEPNGAYHIAAHTLLYNSDEVAAASPNQATLVQQFTDEVTGYARTGNPTVRNTPLWTRFTPRHQQLLSLVAGGDSVLTPVSTIADQHHCHFWNAFTPTPRR